MWSESEGGVAADTHPERVRGVTSAFGTVYGAIFDITAPFGAPFPLDLGRSRQTRSC